MRYRVGQQCGRIAQTPGQAPVYSGGGGTPAAFVAHWLFDDGSGATAADSGPNGYDGTLQNGGGTGAVWGVGYLEFDGDGSYVEVSDDLNVGSSSFRFSINIRTATGGPDNYACLFAKLTTHLVAGWEVLIIVDETGDHGKLYAQLDYDGAVVQLISTATVLDDSDHLIELVINRSNTTAYFYIDTIERGSISIVGLDTLDDPATTGVFGFQQNQGIYPYSGRLWDCEIEAL